MPQASRVGDKDSNDEPLVEGSPTVFIGDSPGSIVIPTISVGAGTGAAFTVPRVTISAAQQAEVNRQTQEYILNPSASRQNPAVTNNQVKENFPGTPNAGSAGGGGAVEGGGTDGGGAADSVLNPTPPASDIPSFLSNVLAESSRGAWSETGMGGRPSNPKIINIWKELGFPQTGAWLSDQTAWCMGFVNWVLLNTGYRFVQTARANDIQSRAAQYKVTSVPLGAGQPGDICLWSYSHVNFIYTANGSKYTFVGGNQSDAAKNANNPSGGTANQSWKSGYSVPGNGSLSSIWRPSKT
jgi:hypothetical protein